MTLSRDVSPIDNSVGSEAEAEAEGRAGAWMEYTYEEPRQDLVLPWQICNAGLLGKDVHDV